MPFAPNLAHYQEISLKQEQKMSARQYQAMKILSLNALQLNTHINQQLIRNPALSIHDPRIDNLDDWLQKEQEYNQDQNSFDPDAQQRHDREIENLSTAPTLAETIEQQIEENFTSEESEIYYILYDNLNMETGLLDKDFDLEEVAQKSGYSVEELEEALEILQEFEPTGVFAYNEQGSLLLQAKACRPQDPLVITILENYFKAIRSPQQIAQALNRPLEQVNQAIAKINKMQPYPGKNYTQDDRSKCPPEIKFFKDQELQWQIEINKELLPVLQVDENYKKQLTESQGKLGKEAKEAIKKNIQDATLLITACEQRISSIKRLAQTLLKKQINFFETQKSEDLHPLTMKEVAEELKVNVSTISRAVKDKFFVILPSGYTETLKDLFTNGYQKEGSNEVTSKRFIRQRILEFIKAEAPQNPLSDQEISDLLKEEGFSVARRTVAKYRESLKIEGSSKRKLGNIPR